MSAAPQMRWTHDLKQIFVTASARSTGDGGLRARYGIVFTTVAAFVRYRVYSPTVP